MPFLNWLKEYNFLLFLAENNKAARSEQATASPENEGVDDENYRGILL